MSLPDIENIGIRQDWMVIMIKCPKCKASLRGKRIPEKHREAYGNATHFSRVIGLYDRNLDRTTHWKCPDCGHVWLRK